MTRFAAAIIVLVSTSNSAWAQLLPTPTVCKTYFAANTKNPPSEIAAALADMRPKPDWEPDQQTLFAGAAIRKCENKSSPRPWYHAQLTPKKSAGVCHFKEYESSAQSGMDGNYDHNQAVKFVWMTKPTIAMMETDGPCPDQSSSAYVLTAGISPGLFHELTTFWARITTSKAAFDDGLSQLSNDKWTRRTESEFRADLEKRLGKTPAIRSIGISYYELADKDFLYEIIVPVNASETWIVGVDFTPQGLKIIRLGKLMS